MRTVETYKLSFYDVMIISCSGLVRGSVAFALI
jgi:predicted nucleic acid-binding protein